MPVPKVALLAYPEFDPFLMSIPHGIFSYSNPEPLFSLFVAAACEECVGEQGSFILKQNCSMDVIEQADIVIIPGWHGWDKKPTHELMAAIISAHRKGAIVVGLCFGAYALAYAGILNGKSASTHWIAENDFRQRFPEVNLKINSLYVEDEGVITSAGSSASIDCCLFIVRKYYGLQLANKIARYMVMPSFREGGQTQYREILPLQKYETNDNIDKVINHIQNNLNDKYSIEISADMANMSRRTFTRHFEKTMGMSFGKWLVLQRIKYSCELLETTQLSVEEISTRVGFTTSTLFRYHFKDYFKISPRQWRKNFCDTDNNR